MASELIYLDHAATGWPKSAEVLRAVETQMRVGVAAGRGGYARALRSSAVINRCRQLAARLFHTPREGKWVIATNGTHALNLALHGLLDAGDHVVTTAIEHNSVLRPLEFLKQQGTIQYDVAPCDACGKVDVESLITLVQPRTRLIAINHASNVTGAVQDLEHVARQLGQRAQTAARPLLLVDAAQSAGVLPLDVSSLGIDLLATPGHKGLGGPLGTGLLYVGPAAIESMKPLLQGGTGSSSDRLQMPMSLPERLEPGNLNVPAIAGLTASLEQLLEIDLAARAEDLSNRAQSVAARLREHPAIQVYTSGELPIVSLTFTAMSPEEVAAVLDAEFGIETRSGLHCAPLIHLALGTFPEGTLRLSFNWDTPVSDLDKVVGALRQIAEFH